MAQRRDQPPLARSADVPTGTIDRLLAKTTKGAGADDCWIWTGYKKALEYGGISIRNRMEFVHRVSWLINRGDIPEGLKVLHECDVQSCWRTYSSGRNR